MNESPSGSRLLTGGLNICLLWSAEEKMWVFHQAFIVFCLKKTAQPNLTQTQQQWRKFWKKKAFLKIIRFTFERLDSKCSIFFLYHLDLKMFIFYYMFHFSVSYSRQNKRFFIYLFLSISRSENDTEKKNSTSDNVVVCDAENSLMCSFHLDSARSFIMTFNISNVVAPPVLLRIPAQPSKNNY